MGKTFKRNSQFRAKKQGRVFVKDQSWKKSKHKNSNQQSDYLPPTQGEELNP